MEHSHTDFCYIDIHINLKQVLPLNQINFIKDFNNFKFFNLSNSNKTVDHILMVLREHIYYFNFRMIENI